MDVFFKLSVLLVYMSVCVGAQNRYDALCPPSSENDTYVPVPGFGCRRFVTCDPDGKAFGPQGCPTNTIIDTNTGRCDYPENVTCDDDGIGCVTKAVRGSCNNFTTCSNGETIPMNCGEDLYFSNEKLVCDWPNNLSREEKIYCNYPIEPPALPNGGPSPVLPDGGGSPVLPNGGAPPAFPNGGVPSAFPNGGAPPASPNGGTPPPSNGGIPQATGAPATSASRDNASGMRTTPAIRVPSDNAAPIVAP